MDDIVTVENILLLTIALFQLGQWVQKRLNSDVNLASRIDMLVKNITEMKAQMKNDYVYRDVYHSEKRDMERRVSGLERKVFNGGWRVESPND